MSAQPSSLYDLNSLAVIAKFSGTNPVREREFWLFLENLSCFPILYRGWQTVLKGYSEWNKKDLFWRPDKFFFNRLYNIFSKITKQRKISATVYIVVQFQSSK